MIRIKGVLVAPGNKVLLTYEGEATEVVVVMFSNDHRFVKIEPAVSFLPIKGLNLSMWIKTGDFAKWFVQKLYSEDM